MIVAVKRFYIHITNIAKYLYIPASNLFILVKFPSMKSYVDLQGVSLTIMFCIAHSIQL